MDQPAIYSETLCKRVMECGWSESANGRVGDGKPQGTAQNRRGRFAGATTQSARRVFRITDSVRVNRHRCWLY